MSWYCKRYSFFANSWCFTTCHPRCQTSFMFFLHVWIDAVRTSISSSNEHLGYVGSISVDNICRLRSQLSFWTNLTSRSSTRYVRECQNQKRVLLNKMQHKSKRRLLMWLSPLCFLRLALSLRLATGSRLWTRGRCHWHIQVSVSGQPQTPHNSKTGGYRKKMECPCCCC